MKPLGMFLRRLALLRRVDGADPAHKAKRKVYARGRKTSDFRNGVRQHTSLLWPFCLFAALFLFFVFFYVKIVPVPPWNGDDWCYLGQFRDMFPSPTRGNPARVFPEVLHPLMGWLGAAIYAFAGRYIDALIISHAVFMAFFIAALCVVIYVCFADMFRKRGLACFLSLLFLVLAFCMFKSREIDNIFLFDASTITTSTFYVIPDIVNSAVVFYIAHGQFTGKNLFEGRKLLLGFFFLALFFAQFSITSASAISCSYAGVTLLLRLWRQSAEKLYEKVLQYVSTFTMFDVILAVILCFWVIAAVFDVTGLRYSRVQHGGWNFTEAISDFCNLLAQLNIVTKIVLAVVLCGASTRFIWKLRCGLWRDADTRFFEIFCTGFVCGLMMTALIVLISARTTIVLSGRISGAYGIFFFLLFCFLCAAAYLLTEIPRLRFLAPTVLALLFFESTNPERPWAQNCGTPYHKAIIEQWILDVREAEAQGKTNAVLTVPKVEWPHPDKTFGKHFSQTIFAHGVTQSRMTVALRGMNPD